MSWINRDKMPQETADVKKELLKRDECPICGYKFADCQCKFGGKAHPDRSKRAKVVADHIYLLSDAQVEHLKKVQKWWQTSYDDEEMEKIRIELESAGKTMNDQLDSNV